MRNARPRRHPVSLKATAIRLLARREYGRAELAQRLQARGGDPAEVARTLDQLAALGYLSDQRFAHGLVAQRSGRYSVRAIAHELRERRVDADAAREALAALDVQDELAQARALWQRRFGVPRRDQRDKARQVRFLLARGFGVAVAMKVLRGTGAEVDGEDD